MLGRVVGLVAGLIRRSKGARIRSCSVTAPASTSTRFARSKSAPERPLHVPQRADYASSRVPICLPTALKPENPH